jgi:hypothetical protein
MSIIRHRSTDTMSEDSSMTDVMGSHEADTLEAPTARGDDAIIVIETTTTPILAQDDAVIETSTVPTAVARETEIYYPDAAVGLFLAAFAAFLLSAWAGIVPYVGPIFGFSADGTSSWTWDQAHTYGALIPGAVAFVACGIILACSRRPAGMQSAGTLALSGFAVFVSGAWLAIFPVAWAVIHAPYFQAASPTLNLEFWLGYATGPGVLLAAFGAFVMGRAGIEGVAHRLINRINVV